MNFYHYKLDEVMELETREFNYLYEAMEKAKATERFKDLDLFVYPHQKQSSAKKTHKRLHDEATPEDEKQGKIVTTKDLLNKGFTGVGANG
jgi:hypothetical protein